MINIASLYTRRAELAFLAGPTFTGPHPHDYAAMQLAIEQAEAQWRPGKDAPLSQDLSLDTTPHTTGAADAPPRYCQMCGIEGRRVVQGTHCCAMCTLAVRNGGH